MKVKRSLLLLPLLLILTGCGSYSTNSKNSTSSKELSGSSETQLPIQKKYPEYTDDIITVFNEIDLNPEDYIPEDTSGSKVNFISESATLTNNYKNMTVDNLNTTFSDTSISAKSIFEKLGRPDVVWINDDLRADGKTTYNVEVWWNETEDTSVDGSDYITMNWPLTDSDAVKSVFGVPSDVPDGANSQSIVELGEFKGASAN
ncbi:hypothetical protein ACVRZS_09360 [Streptococcus ferus]|uniref:Lipoprotein n=1 Tax=Streptococcus ferus TaxID=1345 RepID=A0A2X3XX63_9STRE|nr:hypothetical protein [Streptococcus ferus]SQF38962.1 Uncharacterised protein [Streptococcus ferus]